ncbi:flagellar basal body rod protein FlgB [uncultured Tyzzerella sp.]|uniref:flagellar basal body rod protein FlgB n=1 Tax=uncultured Tyzzerella sp. TaxID=2321398 RepID=UPI002941FBAD|nr:flagellar basal body rod protein FlgB [uncultured Tyzzerella sp.]
MVFDKLFTQNRILETAMQATQYKNQVILNNMANIDTPNYKSKTVNFETALSRAIEETKETGVNHMDKVMPSLKVTTKQNSTTLDGNSIDIETEMIEFYKNSTRYDFIVNSVLSNSNRTNIVYTTFK